MIREIRPALSLVIFFTIAMGFFLPEIFTGAAQTVFPFQAGGSLITQNGQVVGSAIIGQNFTGPTWFNARPSALMGMPRPPPAPASTPIFRWITRWLRRRPSLPAGICRRIKSWRWWVAWPIGRRSASSARRM